MKTCGKMVPILAVLAALAVTARAAAVDPPKPRGQQVHLHLFEATVRVPDRGVSDEYNYRLLAEVLASRQHGASRRSRSTISRSIRTSLLSASSGEGSRSPRGLSIRGLRVGAAAPAEPTAKPPPLHGRESEGPVPVTVGPAYDGDRVASDHAPFDSLRGPVPSWTPVSLWALVGLWTVVRIHGLG